MEMRAQINQNVNEQPSLMLQHQHVTGVNANAHHGRCL